MPLRPLSCSRIIALDNNDRRRNKDRRGALPCSVSVFDRQIAYRIILPSRLLKPNVRRCRIIHAALPSGSRSCPVRIGRGAGIRIRYRWSCRRRLIIDRRQVVPPNARAVAVTIRRIPIAPERQEAVAAEERVKYPNPERVPHSPPAAVKSTDKRGAYRLILELRGILRYQFAPLFAPHRQLILLIAVKLGN